MKKLFPFRTEAEVKERDPELIELTGTEADEVFDSLSSPTARKILDELHTEPQPASDIAEKVDTTIQNVQYHLKKLEGAGLIRVVDTWYSESGSEMPVYGPSNESLTIYAGKDPESSLRRLLKQLVGATFALLCSAVALWLVLSDQLHTFRAVDKVNGTTGAQNYGPDPTAITLVFVLGGIIALASMVALRYLDKA